MASKGDHDFSHLQDVLGSLPMIKRYIVISLCFAVDATQSEVIQNSLTEGLNMLGKAFPFLAGQVIYEGREEGNTGIAKIVPLEESIQLHINDLRDDIPSMAEMSKAKFPFSMLDADIVAPPIAVSWVCDGYDKVAPVLILQASLIEGGIILTFSGNHTTMDATGLGMIISLFAKACRNEPFTNEELKQGNQSRRNAIPLLGDDYQPGSELDDAMAQPLNEERFRATLASDPRWAYFNFRAADLLRLKKEASHQSLVPYISTDDAISALVWQRIAKARSLDLNSTRTWFCRPISTRNYLGLQGYLGHMVDCVYTSEINVHLRPLGEIAGRLRHDLLQDDKIRHHTQAFATVLDLLADKSKLVNGARLDPNRDVVVSSYSNTKICEFSFGDVLGRPEAARRPKMPAWPSLVYLMPRDRRGDVAVAFCVGREDMGRLREDEVLTSFADYVG